jgi:hypothetical protein
VQFYFLNNIPAIFTEMKILTPLWGLLNIALLFFSQQLFADAAGLEYKVKAGYIYNFTKFITWPEDDAATFNLCILGKDPFGNLIDPIEKRVAQGRPIKVFRFDELNTGHQCHILYISTADFSIKNLPINYGAFKTLTVSENDKFAPQGGMIGFVNRDGKIRLQINLDAIKRGGLKISAKLLEVSEIIIGKQP